MRFQQRAELSTQTLERVFVSIVLALAGMFFFNQLGEAPPGLNGDAAAKGLHALKWLQGGPLPFWIPHASAPEPLMVWLQTLTTVVLGPSILALIVPSAAAMVAAALAAYCVASEAGRSLGEAESRWAGLLAGLGFASNVVLSEFGRSGLRATLLPAFEGFTLWRLLVAVRTNRSRDYVAAGCLLGGLAYTYLAARLFPLALAAFFVIAWLSAPGFRAHWRGWALMVAAATFVLLPQLVFFALHPHTFAERAVNTGFASNVLYEQLGFWGLLAHKLWGYVLMLGVEWSGQYNQSARPLLQPLAFAGLIFAALRLPRGWREPGQLALTLALLVMFLPDLIAGDRQSPHEMRSIGVALPAHALSGIGLVWACQFLARRFQRLALGPGLSFLAALTLVGWGWLDWFGDVAPRLRQSAYTWYQTRGVAAANFITSTEAPVLVPLIEYTHSTFTYLMAARVRHFRGALDSSGQVHHPASAEVLVLWPASLAQQRPEGLSYRYNPESFVLVDGDTAWLMPPTGHRRWEELKQFPAQPLTTSLGEQAAEIYRVPFDWFQFPAQVTPTWRSDEVFAEAIRAWGASASQTVLTPGEPINVTGFWETQARIQRNYRYFVHLLDDRQQSRTADNAMPGYGTFETDIWQPGSVIPLQQWVNVPNDLAPGRYWLELGFFDYLTGERPAGRQSNRVLVGPLKVPLPPAAPLAGAQPLSAHLGDSLALRGYTLQTLDDKQWVFTLDVAAFAPPALDYTFFIHLDSATQKALAQADGMPLDGAYPTSLWAAGERVPVTLTVNVPPDLPAGAYTVWLGAYYWPTGERLAVQNTQAQVEENRLLLQTLTWPPTR